MSKARALERHSIHEAGHVVLARSLGVAVTEVSIDADGGVTRFARDLSRDLTEVKIRLAGRAAETLAFASGGGGRRTCRSDRVHAERAAYEITRDLSGVNQLLLATHEEVRGVLSDKWGDVETIARALIGRGSLDASDIVFWEATKAVGHGRFAKNAPHERQHCGRDALRR
jgi:hypothetical protein